MKRSIFTTFFFTLSTLVSAQVYVKSEGSLDIDGDPGSPLFQKKYIPKTVGTKLLFDEYYNGRIYVKGSSQSHNINIDLDESAIFFDLRGEDQYLDFSAIDSIVFEKFNIVFRKGELNGCMLVYRVGNLEILNQKEAELITPNYVKSMDVGSRDNKWVIKDSYYIVRKGKFTPVKLPASKKKVIKFFKDRSRAQQYIAENDLRFKDVRDYVELFSDLYEYVDYAVIQAH